MNRKYTETAIALLLAVCFVSTASLQSCTPETNEPETEEPSDTPDTPGTPDEPSETPDNPGEQPGENPGDQPADDTPENPGVKSDSDDLPCPNPPKEGTVDISELYGYGETVTGGSGATAANTHHFDNGQALQTWLLARKKVKSSEPAIVWLSGTFDSDDGRDFSSAHPWFDVKETSNITFIGTDSFVMDRIGFFLSDAQNIIIRNVYFKQPKADNGADAVSMQESKNVWVDHCTFESMNQDHDYEDGSCDVTHASTGVTVSWNKFIKTQKSCLVGHSSSASADVAIRATFHHNWFCGSSSRHPRVRYGTVHVYNNYYDGNTTYGVGSAMGAKVLVEANVFRAVALPTDIATYPAKKSGSSWVSNLTDGTAGYMYACSNLYLDRPDNANVAVSPYPFTNVSFAKYGGAEGTALSYSDFKPAYEYIVTPLADLASVVKSGAGVGHLGYASAPIEVNNGGVDVSGGGDSGSGSDSGNSGDSGNTGGNNDPVGSQGTYAHNFTSDGFASDSFFTISGNTKTGLSITVAGQTFTQGLKMESSAGEISFNASNAGKLTIYVTTATGAVKVDGNKVVASDNIITVSLEAGKHSITKADSIQVLYVKYEEA